MDGYFNPIGCLSRINIVFASVGHMRFHYRSATSPDYPSLLRYAVEFGASSLRSSAARVPGPLCRPHCRHTGRRIEFQEVFERPASSPAPHLARTRGYGIFMRVTWPVAFMTACVTIGIVDSACGETRAWSQSSNTIQYLADKPGSHFCAMFH